MSEYKSKPHVNCNKIQDVSLWRAGLDVDGLREPLALAGSVAGVIRRNSFVTKIGKI